MDSRFRFGRNKCLALGGLGIVTVSALLLFNIPPGQFQSPFDPSGRQADSTLKPSAPVTRRADNDPACRDRTRIPGVTCRSGRSLNPEFFEQSRMH